MPSKKPERHEGDAKAEANAKPDAMQRFRNLTTRLLKVSPEQIREEQRLHEEERSKKCGG